MKETLLSLLCLLAFIVLDLPDPARAQPNTTGNTCDVNQTAYPCQTYAFYRAAAPDRLDLASIGDLFEVSRLMIAEPSNISFPNASLVPNQPLFVPLTCSCNPPPANNTYNITSISYANISYTIESGDTFYDVSTRRFENLTTFQSVEAVNPTLVPTNLTIGVDAIFPIFCKCPDANTSSIRPNYLVSYVLQPSDNISTVASLFNVSSQSITDLNGNNPQPFDTIFVPVSQLPNVTQPTTFPAPPSQKTERKGVIIGLSIGVGVLGILLILLIGLWFCCGYRVSEKKDYEGDKEEIRKDKWQQGKGEAEVSLMADVSDCLDKYRVFKMEELREATEGFSPRYLIQGSVYRGVVDGEVFAIKKMTWNASEELKILQKVRSSKLDLYIPTARILWCFYCEVLHLTIF
ncbi:hypothetical protein CDL15_Pgr019424 [Punica granatum]|uniref:LysM domain receptor-like kinase 4 n=1 Tax=Punica granatum TaxID=22663 RepID=A0A218XSN7_PUNGR|nr:hypothetical protein CDL15_Pgr019424 [Punica granatum]